VSIDISRKRFKARKDYSGVVMQQGRVQLDADWNEDISIRDRRQRSEAHDTFGDSVVPKTTPDAFRIEAAGGTLAIGPGRMYVDGLQAENHGGGPLDWDPHLAEERGTSAIAYGEQPYLPHADTEAPLPTGPGTHLAYLDVWQREVNHLIDPELVENAVGVDTTARTQTVWQVRVLADVGDVNCATPAEDVPGWLEATAPSAGRLTTGPLMIPQDPDPCLLPPGSGYKGLENHTYRVEIHDSGVPLEPGDTSDPPPAGTATFKWSRDNGVVAAEVVALPALDRLRVSSLGRDEFLRFHDGDWVEVTDNVRELHGRSGFLSKITIDEANSELVLDTPVPVGAFPVDPGDQTTDPERRTRVRRWDQTGRVEDTAGDEIVDLNAALAGGAIPVPPAGTPIQLESGVVITFETPSGGIMRTGDYWVFVARTADGSVEELVEAPPHGIHHHYARLALIHQPAAGDPEVSDCRHPWGCGCCCEISVAPGQDIQAAIDSLPDKGGKVCLKVGLHRLRRPLLMDALRNVVLEGCGPGSALVFEGLGDQGVDAATVHVTGGSRNIGIENLSIYSDRSTSLVDVDGGSAEVSVRCTVLVNVTPSDLAGCVRLGQCTEVAVEDSKLLGLRGVTQVGEGVGVRELRIRGNLIFAEERGIALQDVHGGLMADNRIGPALGRMDGLRRPEEPQVSGGAVDPAGASASAAAGDPAPDPAAALAATPPEDPFLDHLPESFEMLEWAEVEAGELDGLATGIEACLLHGVGMERNRVRASSGVRLHYSRSILLRENDLRVTTVGLATGYAFDLSVEGNRIEVRGGTAKLEVREEHLRIDVRTLGNPDPHGAAVALDFTRGARILENDIQAPSGVVAQRSHRSECPLSSGPSLIRVLGIGKLWRVVLELGWVVFHIVQMLGADDASDDEAEGGDEAEATIRTRSEFEQALLTRWLGFLTGGNLPAFLGKAVVERNRLCVNRFGILARQITTLGGLRVATNRVTGARFTGIEIEPLFSVGLVDRVSGWVGCAIEFLIRFLRLFQQALTRFLDGEPIPDDPGGPDSFTKVSATVITGFMSLCARVCDHPENGDEPHGEADGEPGERPAPERLRDAIRDLLERRCWVQDLLDGAYRISGNTVRGSGTGIQMGIDGARVDENRVTVDPDDTVAWETVVLGLLLGSPDLRTATLSGALMDLDRDMLFFVLRSDEPLTAPPVLPNVMGEFSALVEPGSPLRPWVDRLEGALANGENADARWRDLLAVIWGELRGFGIVLVGGDFSCTGNQVDAREVCFGAGGGSLFADRKNGKRCAVGGIWHRSNLAGLLADLARRNAKDGDQDETVLFSVIALLLMVVLMRERSRALEVSGSRINRALTHGVFTGVVVGLELIDLHDNQVLDAGRTGLLCRGTGSTVRVHRNSVRRTDAVYGFLDRAGHSPSFAHLIEVARTFGGLQRIDGEGADSALVAHNHGDARRLPGEGASAVRVHARSVGVLGNHVLTDTGFAFQVEAVVGLFTDNLSNRGNLISPGAIQEAPNRTNL